jgi:UDP-3-O-[3-hydroxymyristoyl] glucosamine N-acyltransferase
LLLASDDFANDVCRFILSPAALTSKKFWDSLVRGITNEVFMITAAQIHELSTEVLSFVQGPLGAKASKILPAAAATAESLVFVSSDAQLNEALHHKAAIIVAHKSLHIPEKAHAAFFTTPHIQLAMATLGTYFDRKIERYQQDEHIHPKSCIHPTAKLGKNVVVGPFVVIGAETHIGDNCIIGANTVIQSHVKIGANTLVHPLVFIGADTEIGTFCELQPHCSLGADGFSFVPLKASHPVKVPQLGRVVLGNHVEIGAGTTVDRAALTETRIDSGTKLDNLCHIGHNCRIGENGLTAAGFMMAGSTTVGKNFIGGGRTVLSDHLKVTDNVMIGGNSAVTKDISVAGQYAGYPLQSLKDSLKTLATSVHLPTMRKQLRQVMKHLNLGDED